MKNAEAEAARVAACREILDRAYGKATQHMSGEFTAALQVITGVPRAMDDR